MKQPTFLNDLASEESEAASQAEQSDLPSGGPRLPWRRPRLVGAAALGSVLLVLALLAGLRIDAARDTTRPSQASPPSGTLLVETQPAGWHVWDGEADLGVTPLTLTLPAGPHTLVLRRASATRELRVHVPSGGRAAHHLEMPAPPSIGDLRVQTIPPGAVVAVDGIGRGVTPVDVRDLKAGRHVVTLLSGDRVISQEVTVEPGALGSLVVPLAQAGAPAVGWLTVTSPVELEVFEGESLVGSSRNPRLLFMPGRHTLRLVNRELAVDVEKVVEVRPGVTANLPVSLPDGRVSLNATPWAEVFIDGARIGETPIGERRVSLGPHEVVFRHPTLGEQRRSILVPLDGAVRLGVDLRR